MVVVVTAGAAAVVVGLAEGACEPPAPHPVSSVSAARHAVPHREERFTALIFAQAAPQRGN